MRRILSLMLIVTCSMGIALAQETSTNNIEKTHTARRGYRGAVELAPFTLSTCGPTLNLSTTHGYQFSHNFFLGGGVAYYAYPFSYYGETDVPLYVAIQSNIGENLAQFTYGGRLGMILYSKHEYMNQETYLNEVHEGFGGLYFNFNIGLRLGFTPQYAMTIKPQFDIILGRFPCLNLGIGFGFEF